MQLVALHNLTAAKLARCDAWGGLAAPSLAVLEPGCRFGAYGEITLVAPPSLADPSTEPTARLWDRDVYTPEIDAYDVPADLGEAVRKLVASAPTTEPRCGERFNIGRFRAAFARPLPSMDEACEAGADMVCRDVWDELMMSLCEPVADAYCALHPYRIPDPPEAWPRQHLCLTEDRMLRAMAACALGEGSMRACLREFGFVRVPKAVVSAIEELSRTVSRVTMPYFEAKVGRAVALSEFAAAVVPADAPPSVGDILSRHGIGIVLRYRVDEDREDVVERAASMAGALHGEKDDFVP